MNIPHFLQVKTIVFIGLMSPIMLLADDSFLIEQLHNKYQNISYYQASFTQTKNVSYLSKPLITTGQLEFALDTGLIWEVNKPLWVKTLITSKGVYKSTKYRKKQKVKDRQIKLIAEIMTELLTANLDKVASQFEITTANIIDNNWEVHLTPKG
ncbi:MAG: outer membrane lipoprotein carrier protein LolA, partial [Proteobacteria bacterium]|nr:outer membrane lipoprotein carrier protein LolA [Pseudomonadota bacterium]